MDPAPDDVGKRQYSQQRPKQGEPARFVHMLRHGLSPAASLRNRSRSQYDKQKAQQSEAGSFEVFQD